MPTTEIAAAHARLDQYQAGLRDLLFELGCGQVDRLIDNLNRPDARRWLRDQPDEVLELVSLLAGAMATRLHLENFEGALDEAI